MTKNFYYKRSLIKRNDLKEFKMSLIINKSSRAKPSFSSLGNLKGHVLKDFQLKTILKTLTPDNFSVGNDFGRVIDGTFSANLHIHTVHSDGMLSVQGLLEQAMRYAAYRKKIGKKDPFVFAITDHGQLNGLREASMLTSANSELLQNAAIVNGVEMNVHHNGKQIELLGYCVNPKGKLQGFVDKRYIKDKEYIQELLASKINPYESLIDADVKITTLDKLLAMSKGMNVKSNSSFMNGFFRALSIIFERKYGRREHFAFIDELAQNYKTRYGSFSVSPNTPTSKEAVIAINQLGEGFAGVAHPARNNKMENMPKLFTEFKDIGIEAVESNYQGPKGTEHNAELRSLADENGFLHTGGIDIHSDNIFSTRHLKEDLPREIRAIIE